MTICSSYVPPQILGGLFEGLFVRKARTSTLVLSSGAAATQVKAKALEYPLAPAHRQALSPARTYFREHSPR